MVQAYRQDLPALPSGTIVPNFSLHLHHLTSASLGFHICISHYFSFSDITPFFSFFKIVICISLMSNFCILSDEVWQKNTLRKKLLSFTTNIMHFATVMQAANIISESVIAGISCKTRLSCSLLPDSGSEVKRRSRSDVMTTRGQA